jgi:hypothetical protein
MKYDDDRDLSECEGPTVDLSDGDWRNGRRTEYDYYRLAEIPGAVFSKVRGTQVDTGRLVQIPCDRPKPGGA